MRTEWELYAPGMYISTLPINNDLRCVNFYKEEQIIPALLVGVYKNTMEGVCPVGINLQG